MNANDRTVSPHTDKSHKLAASAAAVYVDKNSRSSTGGVPRQENASDESRCSLSSDAVMRPLYGDTADEDARSASPKPITPCS